MKNGNTCGRPVGAGAKKYTYKGRKMTLREWSATLGITYHTLYQRVAVNGMETRDAFVRPLHARKTVRSQTAGIGA